MHNTDWKQVCAACAEGTPPERCAYYGDPNGCNAPTLGKHPEGNLAERLQEALEKAERRIAELERASGNAAALREALEAIDENTDLLDISEGIAPKLHPSHSFVAVQIRKIVRDALAAPARNCDVGTAEEQAERFEQFCLDNHSAEHLCSRCPLGKQLGDDVDVCQLHWAQMPYASAEGGAE